MLLLKFSNRDELSLITNLIENISRYAILSHILDVDSDEITFNHLQNDSDKSKTSDTKIWFCRKQVKKNILQHFWVNMCCIDKVNYTELFKAIISMFRWYRDVVKYYIYLLNDLNQSQIFVLQAFQS